MNGIQASGLVLVFLGALAALTFAFVPDVSLGGQVTPGGPQASLEVDFGAAVWVGVGLACVGGVMVLGARPKTI